MQVKEEGIAYSIPINSGRSFNNSTYTPGRVSTRYKVITPSSKKQAAVSKSLLLLWLSAIAVFQHVDFQHAGFWQAGFRLAAWVSFDTRTVRDFQPCKSMYMPSGLAELEQLHVEQNR